VRIAKPGAYTAKGVADMVPDGPPLTAEATFEIK
jgi:hypothetical protein